MREMKDSGVEWIGKIPNGWALVPNKRVMSKKKNICESYAGENVLSLTMNGVIIRDLDNPSGKMPLSFDGYQYVVPGNLLMCLFDIDVTPRCVGVIENYGVTSPAYSQFAVSEKANVKYYYYYYLNLDYKKVLLHLAKNLRHSLTESQLGDVLVPYPEFEEQVKIASYLDSKCSQIDTIIEKQQAVIEKLKECKLSLITEAVTKGLNPDVPMKDSGVEWIGDVPEHWSVLKFGKCAVVKSNLVNPIDYQEYFQIAPDSIEKNSARILIYRTVGDSGVTSWNHLFYKGQILYSKIRPTLNKVAIAPFDGLCSADMYPIETVNDTKFIVYTILSRSFEAQVSLITENRVKMPKINQSELSNIIISIPDITEQHQIADFLDHKCSAIDATISKKQALIEKLTAYKKSLIYEVVTGKKEV